MYGDRSDRIFFVLGICLTALILKCWIIQVPNGGRYASMALSQNSFCVSLEELPRGDILDRNLIPLTGARWENRVVLFPMVISDRNVVAGELSQILSADVSEINRYLEGGPCLLPHNLTAQQSEAVMSKGWTGVMVFPVKFRYNEKSLASHLIGHLGKIYSREELVSLAGTGKKIYYFDDIVGKTGLEKLYEQDLKGLRPEEAARIYTDARGRLLGAPGYIFEDQAEDKERRNVVLTIDVNIQKAVEDVMDRRVSKGAVVVMEAGSGDILAAASRPSFSPSDLVMALESGEEETFLDRCFSLYQPGSVFKLVLAAAALEEGIVNFNSCYCCLGEKESIIPCWNTKGHGEINFAYAFALSCNPTFVKIGLRTGALKLIDYAKNFGLDNQTVRGYPFPFDRRQDLAQIGAPYNLVNSSIGQGPVLVTPVQVAAMTNVIVSDGIYREPRLVKEVTKNNDGADRKFDPDQGRRVISPETAAGLRSLLELAVDKGTGAEAAIPTAGSAGKTGSAQVSQGSSRINAWFAGYAPRVNPRYIVTILVEDGESGSSSAAPIFREIMEKILLL